MKKNMFFNGTSHMIHTINQNSTVRDTIEQQTTKLATSDTYASNLQPTAKVYQ